MWTEIELRIMAHAVGAYSEKPGAFIFTYCDDLGHPDLNALVEKGAFSGPYTDGNIPEGHGVFRITAKGVQVLKDFGILAKDIEVEGL